jgi:hypothetical protein
MARRVITKEARVAQIAQSSGRNEIDATVMMAIKNLQSQMSGIYKLLADVKKSDNYKSGPEGSPLPANGAPTTVPLINRSGSGRNGGEVVVWYPACSESFTVTTTANDAAVAGVVYADSSDGVSDAIADGESGLICVGGPADVLVDAAAGAILPGDYLVSHTVAGYAAKAVTRDAPGVFAIALEGRASGTGAVAALIVASALANSEALESLISYDRAFFQRGGCCVPHYDADGTATGFSGFVTSASLWNTSAMSRLAAHWMYGYDLSGRVTSAVHSVYCPDGAELATIRKIIEYQQENISRIIAEIS